ncbi:hypothetical protein IJM16_04210 [Candidatus Saccharibacteria bacterium]|nr:hypothetical protein [Candidatus Saccharibacteria bacterium]
MTARIFVDERIFLASEDEVRKISESSHDVIGLHYAFSSYGRSADRVIELKKAVQEDYPDKTGDEMEVWILNRSETVRHVGIMTLFIEVPVEDYLRYKKEGRVEIR